jgi:MFS family permease
MNKTIPYKVLCFCNGLVFFAPVSLLLRTSRGVTLSQFFLLQALLSIAIFIFEIPTGILADKIGHRWGILISQILLFFAHAIFLIAGNLAYFVAEAIIEALASCFMSGTGEAYLYELCKKDSSAESSFAEENAKAGAWGTAGFILSTVAYAGLYHVTGLNGLVIATEVATLVSIAACLCMPEVSTSEDSGFAHNPGASQMILSKKDKGFLFQLLVLNSMLSLSALVVNFLYVEKLEWSGIPVSWMTPVILGYSALNLLIPAVMKRLKNKQVSHIYFAVVCMILLPFMLEIVSMILFQVENEYIDSIGKEDRRAALLSVISMGNNLLEIVFLLLSAGISSGQGNGMFLFPGILLLIFGAAGFWILDRISDKNDCRA